jgi:glutathione S-transferase
MINLYQFAPVWGIPNLGSFCVKIETYMRMAELPYVKHNTLPLKGPKGKLPFIEDNDRKIADSRFIIDYFKETYGDALDSHLNSSQRAVVNAMQRLIEDDLYWVMMYVRWGKKDSNWEINKQAIFGGLPPVLNKIIPGVVRKQILKQIHGHGMGRHTEEEIYAIGKSDLNVLSDYLADKPYFMGDKPTTLDASAFGLLVNILKCPTESPLKEHAKQLHNLVAFCDRIKQQFYSDASSQRMETVKAA